jgi:hypothetical protein
MQAILDSVGPAKPTYEPPVFGDDLPKAIEEADAGNKPLLIVCVEDEEHEFVKMLKQEDLAELVNQFVRVKLIADMVFEGSDDQAWMKKKGAGKAPVILAVHKNWKLAKIMTVESASELAEELKTALEKYQKRAEK